MSAIRSTHHRRRYQASQPVAGVRSRRAFGCQHCGNGLDQDREIQKEALPFDVLDVQVQAFPHGQGVATTDLPQTGYPRWHLKPLVLGWCEQFSFPGEGRPWSDERHLASDDV